MKQRLRVGLGLAAVSFYVAHAVFSLSTDRGPLMIWVCHVGSLLVGLGHLGRDGTTNAVGFLWLSIGTPLWLISLLSGHEELLLTSVGTHGGGLLIGLHGLATLGFASASWRKAAAGLVPMWCVARLATPPEENINFAHGVYKSIPLDGDLYPIFLGAVALLLCIYFLVIEFGLRALLGRVSSDGT